MANKSYLLVVILFLLASCTSQLNSTDDIGNTVVPTDQKQVETDRKIDPNLETADVTLNNSYETTQTLENTSTATLEIPTPIPTHTPRPTKQPSTSLNYPKSSQSIDNYIMDSFTGEIYKFPTITFNDVSIHKNIEGYNAEDGKILLKIDVTMENSGETLAEYGNSIFQAFDQNGVGHDPEYTRLKCYLESYVNVMPGGKLQGCLLFEVPNTGEVTIFYAPYNNDRYALSRSHEWKITWEPNEIGLDNYALEEHSQNNTDRLFSDLVIYPLPDETFGETQYLGVDPITNLEFTLNLLDSNGEVTNQLETHVPREIIYPGEKVIFLIFDIHASFDDVQYELIYDFDYLSPEEFNMYYNEFEILDFKLSQDYYDWHNVYGEIKNIGNSDVLGVGIYVIAYDHSGNIIGYGDFAAGFMSEEFKSGQTSSFDGEMLIHHEDGIDAIDHFEYYFEGIK